MDKITMNHEHVSEFPNGIYIEGVPMIIVSSDEPSEAPAFMGQLYVCGVLAYIGVDTSSKNDWYPYII